jgi:hypothetical protein
VLAALAVALLLPATAFATAPKATTAPASMITATSAYLNGTVNANDKPARWHFDYSTDNQFDESTYTNSTPDNPLQVCIVVCAPILQQDVFVSQRVDNLARNTIYHFRIVASNADGTTYGQDLTFRTLS